MDRVNRENRPDWRSNIRDTGFVKDIQIQEMQKKNSFYEYFFYYPDLSLFLSIVREAPSQYFSGHSHDPPAVQNNVDRNENTK